MEASTQFEVIAQLRTEQGRGPNRRLRQQGKIPAVLYGASKETVTLTLMANELYKQLKNESFYSKILIINIDGQAEQAILKDLHRHPSTSFVLHADFQLVSETEKLYIEIPIHFVHEDHCPGIKEGGGILSRQMTEVEIRCLPKDLPEFIEVDLSQLQLNDVVHLSDLKLPAGVEIVALIQGGEYDSTVAAIQSPRSEADIEGEDGEAVEGETDTD
jgi:large subunit ribosomal protein L25